jgi:hypothetical protein
MTNPEGVPAATNTADYPTQPRWQIAFTENGEDGTYFVHCLRQAEALSRFAQVHPAATVLSVLFTEVPFEG